MRYFIPLYVITVISVIVYFIFGLEKSLYAFFGMIFLLVVMRLDIYLSEVKEEWRNLQ